MRWARNCVISELSRTPEVAGHNPVEAILTTSATLQINNAKLYVPVVTWPINDNIKFLEHLKQGFRRTVPWNKYRSEIRKESNNNKLDCMIDSRFSNINRLLVLSFKKW